MRGHHNREKMEQNCLIMYLEKYYSFNSLKYSCCFHLWNKTNEMQFYVEYDYLTCPDVFGTVLQERGDNYENYCIEKQGKHVNINEYLTQIPPCCKVIIIQQMIIKVREEQMDCHSPFCNSIISCNWFWYELDVEINCGSTVFFREYRERMNNYLFSKPFYWRFIPNLISKAEG